VAHDQRDTAISVESMIVAGSREIGQRLYVSLNTVKTHLRALYRKLGVENRTAAVTRARELGLR
jgi:ATP/maltotriose-dependent transcriptional regulator MalT